MLQEVIRGLMAWFFTISNGQTSINTGGEISGSFTIAGVANETIQSGFMDRNKTIIVFVGTSDNGQMDLGIGLRTSAVPISPSIVVGDVNGDSRDDLGKCLRLQGKFGIQLNLTNWVNIPGELQSIVTGDLTVTAMMI